MHWFAQYTGATQWLMYEDEDGALWHFNGSTSPSAPYTAIYDVEGNNLSTTNLRTILDTPWSGTHYQTFGSRAYLVNGYDEPLVFDGRKASRAGFADAAATPTAELSYNTAKDKHMVAKATLLGVGFAGGDDGTQFAYRYKVSYLNERGQESPASEKSVIVRGTNTNGYRALVTLSIPKGPAGTVARRIYRTQDLYGSDGVLRDRAYGYEFYYLDEVQDNITTIYVDTRHDTMLGALHVSTDYGPFPSSASKIACFKNTMFVTENSSNQIRFSYPRAPEVFPSLNILDIGDADSGPIVAMYATKNALVVFKTQGIYLVKGDHINGFFSFTLTKDTGCIAPKSLREIPGHGLAFMSRDGVYLLEGALENTGTVTGVVRLSQPIEQEFARVNLSSAENVRSVLNRRDKEYWLHVPTGSNVRPNFVLKYHWEIGEWSTSDKFHVNDVLCTGDHRNYVIIASSGSKSLPTDTSETNKGLFVYSRAYRKKGSESHVSPSYQTTYLSMQGIYSSFSLVRVQVSAVGYGKNDLTANLYTNRDLNTTYTTSLSRDQRRALEDFSAPIYGSAKFGDGSIWYEHRPITVRYDISTMHKGPVNELSFVFSPEQTRLEIMGYQMEARVGTKREVVNLTEVYGGTDTR
tara:strand:+ start:1073 stop:2977 length:1905 start_codon:yes stop_codon:yes gene_type:complete